MWATLLVMAIAVCLEPFRMGMTVLMINRPHPRLQLLAFLAGGFAMGTAVGVIVLFGLRPALGNREVHPAQGANRGRRRLARQRRGGGRGGVGPRPRSRCPGVDPIRTADGRARQVLNGRSLWTAGIAGLGIALPSVDYLAALALIVASGAATTVQLGALVLFNVVAFGFVEIPLLCYLVAPDRTRATLSALYEWLRSQAPSGGRRLLAVVGCVLLGAGFAGL